MTVDVSLQSNKRIQWTDHQWKLKISLIRRFLVHLISGPLSVMSLYLFQKDPEKERQKEKEARQGVNLASYRPFFRELDMEILRVLECGLRASSTLDSKVRQRVLSSGDPLIKISNQNSHK